MNLALAIARLGPFPGTISMLTPSNTLNRGEFLRLLAWLERLGPVLDEILRILDGAVIGGVDAEGNPFIQIGGEWRIRIVIDRAAGTSQLQIEHWEEKGGTLDWVRKLSTQVTPNTVDA